MKSMKTLMILLAVFLAHASFSQKLTVRIENVRDDQGQVAVALFDNENDFPKKRVQGKLTPATKGAVEVVFENLHDGEYAISVMHDSNKNGEMDSNMFGMPKEGFGFSNNVMGFMGSPSFEKAKFKLSKDPVVIKLKYLN